VAWLNASYFTRWIQSRLVPADQPVSNSKVRLQTQRQGQYRGMVDAFVKITREEKLIALYRGVQSPLAGLTVFTAFQFFSYGVAKSVVRRVVGRDQLSMADCFVAGTIAGLSESILASPIDLFKSQLQRPNHQYRGLLDCARQIASHHGVSGWYRGLGATMLRDGPGSGVYWVTYEGVKRFLVGEEAENAPSWCVLLAGGAAGLAYWFAVFPLDVIKTSIQSDNIAASERKYKGVIDCSRKIYNSGPRGFLAGIAPCLLRSAPANALSFWVYERIRHNI